MKVDGVARLVCIILISVTVALFAYSLIVTLLVNPYLGSHTWKLISNNLDTYNNGSIQEVPKVYFIGNSQVMAAVDPAAIEQGLYNNNATYRVFNLGVNFDTPLQRSIELRDIIDSKPSLVIYGDSYCSFSSRYRYVPDDNIALVSGRVRIDAYTRSLFDPEQVALMEQNPFDQLLFKRKFIVPAIKNRLGITLGGRDVVVNDSLTLEEKMIIVKNPYDEFLAPVDSETNVQKKAFIHMGDEFRKAGIPFVYIHMPMETLRVETITNETKANYFDFLNSSGVRYYNFENTYPDSDFFDLVHLNKYGKSRFSSDMPAFILQELN